MPQRRCTGETEVGHFDLGGRQPVHPGDQQRVALDQLVEAAQHRLAQAGAGGKAVRRDRREEILGARQRKHQIGQRSRQRDFVPAGQFDAVDPAGLRILRPAPVDEVRPGILLVGVEDALGGGDGGAELGAFRQEDARRVPVIGRVAFDGFAERGKFCLAFGASLAGVETFLPVDGAEIEMRERRRVEKRRHRFLGAPHLRRKVGDQSDFRADQVLPGLMHCQRSCRPGTSASSAPYASACADPAG